MVRILVSTNLVNINTALVPKHIKINEALACRYQIFLVWAFHLLPITVSLILLLLLLFLLNLPEFHLRDWNFGLNDGVDCEGRGVLFSENIKIRPSLATQLVTKKKQSIGFWSFIRRKWSHSMCMAYEIEKRKKKREKAVLLIIKTGYGITTGVFQIFVCLHLFFTYSSSTIWWNRWVMEK